MKYYFVYLYLIVAEGKISNFIILIKTLFIVDGNIP